MHLILLIYDSKLLFIDEFAVFFFVYVYIAYHYLAVVFTVHVTFCEFVLSVSLQFLQYIVSCYLRNQKSHFLK